MTLRMVVAILVCGLSTYGVFAVAGPDEDGPTITKAQNNTPPTQEQDDREVGKTVPTPPPTSEPPANSQSADADVAGNEPQPRDPVLPILSPPTEPSENKAPAGAPVGPPTGGGMPTPRVPILDPVSRQISFQAVLLDGTGTPLPGPMVDLQFRVYTSPGGVLVGVPITVLGVSITAAGVVDTLIPVPAASVDGSGRELGVRVDIGAGFGAELAPRIVLASALHAYRVDRVASEELDDDIALGDATTLGTLDVHDGNGNVGATVDGDGLFGGGGQVDLFDETGVRTTLLGSSSTAGGFVELYDEAGNRRINLDGDANGATAGGGGLLQVWQSDGSTGVIVDGDDTNADGGGSVNVYDNLGSSGVELLGEAGTVEAEGGIGLVAAIGGNNVATLGTNGTNQGVLRTFDAAGTETSIWGTSAGAGAFANLRQGDGSIGINLDGDAGTDAGGVITVRDEAGLTRVTIDGDHNGATAGGGGVITVNQSDGSTGVVVDGDDGNADGGGLVTVRDSVSQTRVSLRGESTGTGGEISIFDDDGTETIEMLGAESSTQGASIRMRDAAGVTTIELDSDFNGDGRIITEELQITGGSDLSEQFDVSFDGGKVEPGMVVCIDPKAPGKLTIGSRAYDRRVAGIISGAGNVETGIYMGQRGTPADGTHPIALTGRVYCRVDTSNGAIEPGDLLTTSNTPGYAMKVTDHARAHGAVIGKAMTSLTEARGLVLVLVSLQ